MLAGFGIAAGTLIFGPVLLALAVAAMAPADEEARWSQSGDLLWELDRRQPSDVLLLSIHDTTIEDCGHRPEQLFAAQDGIEQFEIEGEWTPFRGYFDLAGWRSADWRTQVSRRQRDFLTENTSAFSSVFLTSCMRQTFFGAACANYVEGLFEASQWHRSPSSLPTSSERPDQTRVQQTICTYLDGVAAKAGQRLPVR